MKKYHIAVNEDWINPMAPPTTIWANTEQDAVEQWRLQTPSLWKVLNLKDNTIDGRPIYIKEAPITSDELQSREESAFFAGANYIFVRMGMWRGEDINFYQSYFKQCKKEGRRPNLVSMIAEEVHGMAQEYAKGWRADDFARTEPTNQEEVI